MPGLGCSTQTLADRQNLAIDAYSKALTRRRGLFNPPGVGHQCRPSSPEHASSSEWTPEQIVLDAGGSGVGAPSAGPSRGSRAVDKSRSVSGYEALFSCVAVPGKPIVFLLAAKNLLGRGKNEPNSEIVVIEPCQLFREGLVRLLERCGLAPTSSGRTLAEALEKLESSELPNIAICGLERETDLEAWLSELALARAALSFRVIVLAHSCDRRLASRAVASGIDALLSKEISGEVLQRSLELVMLGQQLFPAFAVAAPESEADPWAAVSRAPSCPARPVADLRVNMMKPIRTRSGTSGEVLLSEREDQILRYLVAGSPNKLIGRSLGITEATVKVHIKSLLRKLSATNRTQAAIWAMNHGMNFEAELPMPRLANGAHAELPSLQLLKD